MQVVTDPTPAMDEKEFKTNSLPKVNLSWKWQKFNNNSILGKENVEI